MNILPAIELVVVGALMAAYRITSLHWRFIGQHTHPVSQRDRMKMKTSEIKVIPPAWLGIPPYVDFARVRMNDYAEEEHPRLSTVKDLVLLLLGGAIILIGIIGFLHRL